MARTIIPEREREICHRLRLWRECFGFTRVNQAKSLGVKVEWLSSYEYARAPLRYEAARRIIGCLAMNPVWLATGKGSMRPKEHVSLPTTEELEVSPRGLFSNVYDKRLKEKLEADPRLATHEAGTRRALAEDLLHIHSKVAAEELLKKKVHEWLRGTSNEGLAHFVAKLIEYGELLRGASGIPSQDNAFVQRQMVFLAEQRIQRKKKSKK
jgi:hypothetical protein